TPREMVYFLWQQTLALVLSAALILLLTSPRPSVFKWLFSLRPSVFVGQRCYSIYLWHWPIIWLLLVTVRPDPLVMLMIVAPLVLVLSCLSYHYLELPFMSLRNALIEFPQPRSAPEAVRPRERHTRAWLNLPHRCFYGLLQRYQASYRYCSIPHEKRINLDRWPPVLAICARSHYLPARLTEHSNKRLILAFAP